MSAEGGGVARQRYPANLAHLADEPHCIYVIWHNDLALYVGMTSDWEQRLKAHGHYWGKTPFRPAATHMDVWHAADNRHEAEVVEADTIRTLDPIYNSRHSPRAARRDAEWAEYSEWADAYRNSWRRADCEWALDQATADRVCALVGYVAPNIAADQAERRASMVRAVNSLPPILPRSTPQAS